MCLCKALVLSMYPDEITNKYIKKSSPPIIEAMPPIIL